ncbi:hypothetical protein L2D00_13700 [Hyphomonadaceae bacterium BL14]|nr:hypothetical protein L2D00_13700 [Hyphomonadaceae bacterium BL14]
MPSPNLAVTHVAAAQNQKEVTINDAIDALDRALTDTLALDLSTGALTLTAAQFRGHMALRPAAALSGPATVTVPALRRLFAVLNTDAVHGLTVQRGTASVLLVPGESAVLICDGSANGLLRAGSGAPVYDFGMVANETPAAGAVLGKVVMPRALVIPASLAGSVAHADTLPDDAFEITLTRNGTAVGSVTINPDASVDLSTAGGAPVTITPGDIIRFLAPAAADASIAGISLTIAARRIP